MNSNKEIQLPASKSIAARLLVASFFAGTLDNCKEYDDCDDLRVIQKALRNLARAAESPEKRVEIDVHASGTAMRLMAAVIASTPGVKCLLGGIPRLCARPMMPLVDAINNAGGSIRPLGPDGKGPFEIDGCLIKGGDLDIRGDVSSQFISALMLAAPTWSEGMKLHFTTPLVSRPYAVMTASVMARFGVKADLREDGVVVPYGAYVTPEGFSAEADWSAAAFFYEAASLMSGDVAIGNLLPPADSMQGDSLAVDIFERLGISSYFSPGGQVVPNLPSASMRTTVSRTSPAPSEIEIDMTPCPDMVPALTLACLLNDTEFLFTGVRNLRVKESDRLEAMRVESGKLGFVLEIGDDSLAWKGERCDPSAAPIATYGDHRIAMAFAVTALKSGAVAIENPDVVAKSFENFWHEIAKLGLSCTRDGNIMKVTLL